MREASNCETVGAQGESQQVAHRQAVGDAAGLGGYPPAMRDNGLLICRDDLDGPEIRVLLAEHLADMHRISPRESVHALDLDALRRPEITLWTGWLDGALVGCGALMQLDPHHGEVKSMRTAAAHRRGGVGKAVLAVILDEARKRSYTRLSLETGSQPEFEPARRLYASFGFTFCPPFGDYVLDPNSMFMTRAL